MLFALFAASCYTNSQSQDEILLMHPFGAFDTGREEEAISAA